jgi:predicted MFS family arabinose efflux permease
MRDGTRAWLAVGSVTLASFVMVTTKSLPIGLLSATAIFPRDLPA